MVQAAFEGRTCAMSKGSSSAKVARTGKRLSEPLSDCARRKHEPGQKPRRKVLLVSAGGGFCIQVASLGRHCPRGIDLLIVGPDDAECRLRDALNGTSFAFRRLRFGRRQRRERTVLGSLPDLLLGTMSALEIVWRERPDAVVGIGQRAAVYFLLAARLFGIRTVFVECVTRVTKPSTTARIIAGLRLADHLYVQWPQAAQAMSGSLYRGRLV
jgi:hypothetical protein